MKTIELALTGSPRQRVVIQLDTGSTDSWSGSGLRQPTRTPTALPSARAFSGTTGPPPAHPESSVLVPLTYGVGNATVEWVTDTVSVGCKLCSCSNRLRPRASCSDRITAATIEAQRFGVAIDSFFEPFGILGVGPNVGGSHPVYSYFIDSLAKQGLGASRAFSLDLRSIDSPDGSIIWRHRHQEVYRKSCEASRSFLRHSRPTAVNGKPWPPRTVVVMLAGMLTLS